MNQLVAMFFAASVVFVSCNNDDDNDPDPDPIAQDSVMVGNITKDTTLSGVAYIKGFVYVKEGVTLTIEPGTVVKGILGYRSSLVIERGGKLMAEGTAQNPIVFTSDAPAGARRSGDWGGVVICGKAPVNKTEPEVEGGLGVKYGGNDVNDNSGIIKYVRIEFAGFPLEPNKEINSLTLCGVGAGTTIEYVQCSYGNDDSFEFFGGTVNAKYLIAYKGVDDDFDTDYGFSGKIQFGVAIRDKNIADVAGDSNGFESDNDADGSSAEPLTKPVFSNMTFIGALDSVDAKLPNTAHNSAMRIRRNSHLTVYNTVFVGYPYGLILESAGTAASFQIRNSFGAVFTKNQIYKIGPAPVDSAGYKAVFEGAGFDNKFDKTILRKKDLKLKSNGMPEAGSAVLARTADFTNANLTDNFFNKTVTFVGAFGNEDWTAGWANFDPQTAVY